MNENRTPESCLAPAAPIISPAGLEISATNYISQNKNNIDEKTPLIQKVTFGMPSRIFDDMNHGRKIHICHANILNCEKMNAVFWGMPAKTSEKFLPQPILTTDKKNNFAESNRYVTLFTPPLERIAIQFYIEWPQELVAAEFVNQIFSKTQRNDLYLNKEIRQSHDKECDEYIASLIDDIRSTDKVKLNPNEGLGIQENCTQDLSVGDQGTETIVYPPNKQINDPISGIITCKDKSVLTVSKYLNYNIDENTLQAFLQEAEFDDDITIENNTKNDEMVFFGDDCLRDRHVYGYSNDSFAFPCTEHSSAAKRISKTNGEEAYMNRESDAEEITPTMLNDQSGFLNLILSLNSKLEVLIKNCRIMNSDLKGIVRKDMMHNTIFYKIESTHNRLCIAK